MGYSYTAYHFFGAHIPSDWWSTDSRTAYEEGERLDPIIRELGLSDKSAKVSHLSAGRYDDDMLFLCISVEGADSEVALGSYALSPILPVLPQWDRALRILASSAGYPAGKLVCGWITVPSLD